MADCTIKYTCTEHNGCSVLDGDYEDIIEGLANLVATFVWSAIPKQDQKQIDTFLNATLLAVEEMSEILIDEFYEEGEPTDIERQKPFEQNGTTITIVLPFQY